MTLEGSIINDNTCRILKMEWTSLCDEIVYLYLLSIRLSLQKLRVIYYGDAGEIGRLWSLETLKLLTDSLDNGTCRITFTISSSIGRAICGSRVAKGWKWLLNPDLFKRGIEKVLECLASSQSQPVFLVTTTLTNK